MCPLGCFILHLLHLIIYLHHTFTFIPLHCVIYISFTIQKSQESGGKVRGVNVCYFILYLFHLIIYIFFTIHIHLFHYTFYLLHHHVIYIFFAIQKSRVTREGVRCFTLHLLHSIINLHHTFAFIPFYHVICISFPIPKSQE